MRPHNPTADPEPQPADGLPPGDSYSDVKRACHNYLMRTNPIYARDHSLHTKRMRTIAAKRKR